MARGRRPHFPGIQYFARQGDGRSSGIAAQARAETFIRTYVRYAHNQPALHKFILQESSHPSARLDWLVENHLKPLFDIVVKSLRELQQLGIAPPGDPAILFNMIRVSAGGLLALGEEIKGTSNIDFDSEAALDELADMIIRCFLPGDEVARQ